MLLPVVLAVVAAVLTPAASDDILEGFCEGVTAGIFPHPDPQLCYKYVSCVFEEFNVYQCAEDFVFDDELFECVPGSWDDCISNVDPELEEFCSEVSFGVFEYPGNCTRFIFCELGRPTVIDCLEDEIWWQEQGVCLFGNRDTCQPGDIFCMGRPDGIIPHPNGCEFFIECLNERSTELECPRGHIFSFGLNECVVGSAQTCRSLEDVCVESSESAHPHPDFCDSFIRCENNHARIEDCGENEIFRPDIRFCVPGDAQTCIPSRPEVACEGRPDGIVPHPDECNQFIRCEGGSAIVETCPTGMILRPELAECVAGDSETCELMDGVCVGRPNGYVIEHPNYCGMFIWCQDGEAQVHNCPWEEILRPDMQFCVPGNSETCDADPIEEMCDGRSGPVIYPHPYRCDQYMICEEENQNIFTCPDDHIVEPGTIRCVPGNPETCTLYNKLCVGRPDGVIPHPSRCQLYISCYAEQVTIESCPDGHIFDSTESRCIPGNTETCDNLDDYCIDLPDGIIPHPNRCDLFMRCSDGVTSVHSCPWGEILRPDMEFCVPGDRDTCEVTPIEKMCAGREGPTIYPHPEDCTVWIKCLDGQLTVQSCQEGNVIQPGTIQCVPGNSETCELYVDRCADIEQGLLPHPSGCHLFLRCTDGQTSVGTCVRGTIFVSNGSGGSCVVGNIETCESLIDVCGALPDQVIPHPNYCDLLIECRDGVTTMRPCAEGLILHPNMQVCSPGDADSCEHLPVEDMCLGQPQAIFPPPDQTQCSDFVICSNGLATVSTCPVGTVLRPRFLDCVPGDIETCEYFPHLCLFRPNENIAHPTRCDLFISCISEVAHIVPCDRGATFAPETGLCAPGDQDTCESFFDMCDGLETAILEHPIHCDVFVVCMSGQAVVFACSIGQILDPERLVCAPGDADTCELYPMPETSIGSCLPQEAPGCEQKAITITDEICEKSGTYNVPYPFACQKYVQCISRRARVRDCPQTHVFNSMLNICIPGTATKCKVK
ncbi:uncharacterized protein LOC129722461 [Wyeomyia smithii]|uniref:uncharacterized protein LOC129722461 n=1 Tax=Wyeomyia smithii TaxID=174621 RepID=UPI002467B677|nr:uncharacterized protein LOC129722461 [Wyeomyia smithii]